MFWHQRVVYALLVALIDLGWHLFHPILNTNHTELRVYNASSEGTLTLQLLSKYQGQLNMNFESIYECIWVLLWQPV